MPSRNIPIAIQLYSVRDVAEQDVSGTLQTLADMGYQGVEFAGTYGLTTPELRAMLDNTGLACAGAHVPLTALEGEALAETIATYRQLGTERLIIPYANMTELDAIIPRMKAAHENALKQGVRLGFHNHKAEFETQDGVTHFDHIFKELPDDFFVQLDIGWVTAAGQDASALIKQYGKRIQAAHVKEFDPANPTAVVGEGTVDWNTTLKLLQDQTAVEWFVVEQEKYEVNSLESARGCIENLKKLGW
jgi:sugar phosphate isomerase/epimerase